MADGLIYKTRMSTLDAPRRRSTSDRVRAELARIDAEIELAVATKRLERTQLEHRERQAELRLNYDTANRIRLPNDGPCLPLPTRKK
jgi:hypothetical protein